jgi:hypothetical protein
MLKSTSSIFNGATALHRGLIRPPCRSSSSRPCFNGATASHRGVSRRASPQFRLRWRFNGATVLDRGVSAYSWAVRSTEDFSPFPRTQAVKPLSSVYPACVFEKHLASQAVAVSRTSQGFGVLFRFALSSIVKERCFGSADCPELSQAIMAPIAKSDGARHGF